jgi:cytochrome b561
VAFRLRRIASLSVTLLVIAITWLALEHVRRSLGAPSTASGWTLLASTLGLYALGLRKRFMRRALGPVAAWLQMHTYLGAFALVVFVWHVGWPVRGQFELALAGMFLFISMSGGVLLWYSRRVPQQLAAVKIDYRLEDIPRIQAALALEAHKFALESSNAGTGATLAEYYQRRLLGYFHSRRNWFYRCLPTGAKRRKLLRELEDLDRYLDQEGREFRRRLSTLVIARDDTDFHQALQRRLRFLVTSHVALTWSRLMMIAVHVVLVLRFQGVLR